MATHSKTPVGPKTLSRSRPGPDSVPEVDHQAQEPDTDGTTDAPETRTLVLDFLRPLPWDVPVSVPMAAGRPLGPQFKFLTRPVPVEPQAPRPFLTQMRPNRSLGDFELVLVGPDLSSSPGPLVLVRPPTFSRRTRSSGPDPRVPSVLRTALLLIASSVCSRSRPPATPILPTLSGVLLWCDSNINSFLSPSFGTTVTPHGARLPCRSRFRDSRLEWVW